MALIVQTTANATAGTPGTGPTVDSSGGTGIYIIENHAFNGVDDTKAPTDSYSNTYVQVAAPVTSGSFCRLSIWYCESPTVGAAHNWTVSTQYGALSISVHSGTASSSSLDQHSGAATATTPAAPGSITPTTANQLVIAGFGEDTIGLSDTISVNGGFSTPNTIQGTGFAIEPVSLSYLLQTSAAAANPSWTYANSNAAAAVIASFKTSGGSGVTGSGALLEIQDTLVASGSVLVSGSGALVEVQDTIAASGSVLVSGAGALLEIQDSIAATGADVAGAAAWTEIQDALAAQGSITLPAVTGSAAWTEIQDVFAGIGNNGILALDVGDPGLRKRRKREAAAAAKLVEDYRERQAYRRKQIVDAFERVIEGRSDVPTAMVDEIIAITEMRHAPDELPRLDFTELIHNTVRLQRLWDEFLERDDEEVLVLL